MNQIKLVFDNIGYNVEFARNDIKTILNIKESRTTEIISLLTRLKIIEKLDGSTYRFVKK